MCLCPICMSLTTSFCQMCVSYYVCSLDVCLLLRLFARCMSPTTSVRQMYVSYYVFSLDVCLLLCLFARCVSYYVCSLDVSLIRLFARGMSLTTSVGQTCLLLRLFARCMSLITSVRQMSVSHCFCSLQHTVSHCFCSLQHTRYTKRLSRYSFIRIRIFKQPNANWNKMCASSHGLNIYRMIHLQPY